MAFKVFLRFFVFMIIVIDCGEVSVEVEILLEKLNTKICL